MNAYLSKTDRELATLLMANDAKALSAFYFKYIKQLYYFVIRTAKSPDLTEDIIQETFTKLWENRLQINPDQSIKSYLFTIAHNHLLNLLKRAQHEHQIMDELRRYTEPIENTTELWLDYQESNSLINEAINQLPPQQKEVFVLCKQEGLSYKNVADKLGITEGTVNSHMVKALKSIKRFILLRNTSFIIWLYIFYK